MPVENTPVKAVAPPADEFFDCMSPIVPLPSVAPPSPPLPNQNHTAQSSSLAAQSPPLTAQSSSLAAQSPPLTALSPPLTAQSAPLHPPPDPSLVNVDDIRVGGGGFSVPSESATEDASVKASGPLTDRLVDKNWKTRKGAYEELCSVVLDTSVSDLKTLYVPLFKAMVADPNAAAQESGVMAVVAVARVEDVTQDLVNSQDTLIPLLLDKCLTGRGNTKAAAGDLLLLLVEVGCGDQILEAAIKRLSHKVPKLVCAVLEVAQSIVAAFGPRAIPLKPLFKPLVGCFEHSDQGVRGAAMGLMTELFRWLGEALRPHLADLRPAQLKELDALFVTVLNAGTAVPNRTLRSQRDAPPSAAVSKPMAGAPAVSARDLCDPVDILSNLQSSWSSRLSSPKWLDKKEAIDELITLLSAAPVLASGDYTDVIQHLKNLLHDINVSVVTAAVRALGLLAQGLHHDFPQAKALLPLLLGKFKEKKQGVLDAVHTCLLALYVTGTMPLLECMDDISGAGGLGSKVPSIRLCTLQWLTEALKQSSVIVLQKLGKPLSPHLALCLDDPTSEVRDAATLTWSTLVSLTSWAATEPTLDKLDKIKADKVRCCVTSLGGAGSATPGCVGATNSGDRSTPPPPSRPSSAAPKAAKPVLVKKRMSDAPAATTDVGMPSGVVDVPPPTIAVKAPSRTVAPRKAPPKKDESGEVEGAGITVAEAIERANELVPSSITTLWESKNWKERVQAVEELRVLVEGPLAPQLDAIAEVIFRYVYKQTNTFKDVNFQVVTKSFEVLSLVASTVSHLPRFVAAIPIAAAMTKLADQKVKGAASDLLLSLAEACGPHLVVSQLYRHSDDEKNPKVVAEVLTWIGVCLTDFGVGTVPASGLIDFTKGLLDHSNPAVKKEAVGLLLIMRAALGPGLRSFLDDCKPALLKTIDAEFAKVSDVIVTAPTRMMKGGDEDGVPASTTIDLPRTDITKDITPTLLKNLANSNWKVRQEGLVAVEEALQAANRRVEGKLGELMNALKLRLQDTNKNLVVHALGVIGKVAAAVGPSVTSYAKIIVPAVLEALADKKSTVRQAAIETLNGWMMEGGLAGMFRYVAPAVAMDSPDGRQDVLAWLVTEGVMTRLNTIPDLVPIVKPLVTCLEDKVSEVRQVAERVLEYVAGRLGMRVVKDACRDVKPASMLVMKPILSRIESVVGDAPGVDPVIHTASATTLPDVIVDHPSPASPHVVEIAPAPIVVKASAVPRPSSRAGSTSSSNPRPSTSLHPSIPELVPATIDDAPRLKLADGTNAMERREKKDHRDKWEVGDTFPKAAQVQRLKEELATVVPPSLHSDMFSSDSKKHWSSLQHLSVAVSTDVAEAVASVDLLFKYATIRLWDANATSVTKSIEFLDVLLDVLARHHHPLSDYVASLIVPFILEKSGNNKEYVRQSFRDLLTKTIALRGPKETFTDLMDGLRSKNSRSRVEILDEIEKQIRIHTWRHVVTGPAKKMLGMIAAMIGDRDRTVSNQAAAIVALAYGEYGEVECFKMLGAGFPEAHRTLILDKVKYGGHVDGVATSTSHATVATPPPSKGRTSTMSTHDVLSPPRVSGLSDTRESVSPFHPLPSDTPEALRGKATPQYKTARDVTGTSSPSQRYTRQSDTNIDLNATSGLLATASFTNAPLASGGGGGMTAVKAVATADWACREMTSGDEARQVDAMKAIVKIVSEQEGVLVVDAATTLAACLTHQLHLAFAVSHSLRLCKYLVNTLMQFFSRRVLASTLRPDDLHQLLQELISRLLDEALMKMEDGEQLRKALNVLVLKILENSNKQWLLSTLLLMLRPATGRSSAGHPLPPSADLVIKCLLRLTRMITACHSSLDFDQLLMDVHDLLAMLPLSREYPAGGLEDLALRTVKTLVNEIAKVQPALSSHLSLVPAQSDLRLLVTSSVVLAPSSISSPGDSTRPTAELADIFRRIGNTATAEQAVGELQDFKHRYPDVNIEAHLSKTSESFREFIHNKLVDKENTKVMEGEGGGGSNVAGQYMDRLRDLQAKYGMKSESGAVITFAHPSSTTSSSVIQPPSSVAPVANMGDDLTSVYRDRLRDLQSKYLVGEDVDGGGDAGPDKADSVSALRERMKKVKHKN